MPFLTLNSSELRIETACLRLNLSSFPLKLWFRLVTTNSGSTRAVCNRLVLSLSYSTVLLRRFTNSYASASLGCSDPIWLNSVDLTWVPKNYNFSKTCWIHLCPYVFLVSLSGHTFKSPRGWRLFTGILFVMDPEALRFDWFLLHLGFIFLLMFQFYLLNSWCFAI